MSESTTTGKKRWSWPKRLLVAGLALVVVLAGAGIVVMVTKPWYRAPAIADPSDGGRRVTERGMVANYYPGAAGSPTVLVVGGSEGGLARGVDYTAATLHAQTGYTTMALAYWGVPGKSEIMEHVPLEEFDTAIDWLKQQPEVDATRIAFMGTSKGGEAAVLLASRHQDLKAVVAYVPSHVVWAGVNMREPWLLGSTGSTWSVGGQPLPYLPYTNEYRGGPITDIYRLSLKRLPEHQDAIIEVERATAPLLLVCGEADAMWPSCDMSREVKRRADERGGPSVTVLAYPDAGHLLSGPPLPPEVSFDLTQLGGTPEGATHALDDSWVKVKAFLAEHL